ncbi:MAG: hypothetical protein RL618_1610 [Pseudomonadota bacterium]
MLTADDTCAAVKLVCLFRNAILSEVRLVASADLALEPISHDEEQSVKTDTHHHSPHHAGEHPGEHVGDGHAVDRPDILNEYGRPHGHAD